MCKCANEAMGFHVSRITFHVSRITFHVSRFTFYVCLLCFACWEPSTHAQSQSILEASYRRANADYERGQYQQAIEKYEQIAASIQNGNVYYNLGNAYFRLGERGKAIVNYERAKRLMPRDQETVLNLKIARALNPDAFDLVKVPSGFSLLYGALHPDEIVWLGLVPYWMAAVSGIGLLFSRKRQLKQICRSVALTGCLTWVFFLLLLGLKIRELNVPYAIVTANEVAVRSEPHPGAAEITRPLHEGTKVQLKEERGDWVKIYLPDENAGWLPAEAIEKI